METLKRIGLIVHGGRADAPAYARRAVEALQSAGAQVWAERDAAAKLSLPALEEIQSVNALVSLGATVRSCGRYSRQYACRRRSWASTWGA